MNSQQQRNTRGIPIFLRFRSTLPKGAASHGFKQDGPSPVAFGPAKSTALLARLAHGAPGGEKTSGSNRLAGNIDT